MAAPIREALTCYLDGRQQDAYALGTDLFGRHRSGGDGATARSIERKAHIRDRLHARRVPESSFSTPGH